MDAVGNIANQAIEDMLNAVGGEEFRDMVARLATLGITSAAEILPYNMIVGFYIGQFIAAGLTLDDFAAVLSVNDEAVISKLSERFGPRWVATMDELMTCAYRHVRSLIADDHDDWTVKRVDDCTKDVIVLFGDLSYKMLTASHSAN